MGILKGWCRCGTGRSGRYAGENISTAMPWMWMCWQKKAEQRQSKRGFNTKKSENIISNGSIIVINEGQCMMIVEQGKVVEVCAEAGRISLRFRNRTQPVLWRFEGKHQGKLPSVRQACRFRR